MTTLKHWDDLLSGEVAGPPGPDGASQGAVGDVDSVSGMQSKVAVRDSAGDSAFRIVAAATRVEVGTTATGKASLQVAAPTAAGHLQVDPTTGIASVYRSGAARELTDVRYLAPFMVHKQSVDASALSVIAEHPVIDRLGVAIELTGISLRFYGSVTANQSNYAVFEIKVHAANGDILTTIIGETNNGETGTGNISTYEVVELDAEWPVSVPSDGFVSFLMYKEGFGVELPSGCCAIRWRPAAEE